MFLDYLYPMALAPIFKTYIWGGKKIEKIKNIEGLEKIAESWEIVDREEEQSVIANGFYKGRNLHELLGEDLLGNDRSYSCFPLLIKFIDAAQNLSIQVHPDKNAADLLQAEPKTEMWYILECEEKAAIMAGFKQKVTQEEIEKAIIEKKLPDMLTKFAVSKGDLFYIPAGTPHAILQGSLLMEIQQNSNTTYRLYDWDRKTNGNARELHISQALASMNYANANDVKVEKNSCFSSPFFTFQKHTIETKKTFYSEKKSFQLFFLIEGQGNLSIQNNMENMEPFRCYLCPAKAESVLFTSEKKSTLLLITL